MAVVQTMGGHGLLMLMIRSPKLDVARSHQSPMPLRSTPPRNCRPVNASTIRIGICVRLVTAWIKLYQEHRAAEDGGQGVTAVVIRPIELSPSVNHIALWGPAVMPFGPLMPGPTKLETAPSVVIRPIELKFVNHRAPSGPAAI